MTSKTAEDRQHDYRLALVGFVLTTLAGGGIAFIFKTLENRQRQATEHADAANQLIEQRRTASTALFDELSPLMDKRLFLWRRVLWALQPGTTSTTTSELAARRASYSGVIDEWNFRLNRNRALLCRFFGPEVGGIFETQIVPQFKAIHDGLAKTLRKEPAPDLAILETNADKLNTIIYAFNNRLAEAIRRGDLGSTDPGNACHLVGGGGDSG